MQCIFLIHILFDHVTQTVTRCIADLSLMDTEMWSTPVLSVWHTFSVQTKTKQKKEKKSWSTHLFRFSFSFLLFLLPFLFRCLLFSKLCWTWFLFFYILVHNICWSIFFLFTLRIFIRLPVIYIKLKGESCQFLGSWKVKSWYAVWPAIPVLSPGSFNNVNKHRPFS